MSKCEIRGSHFLREVEAIDIQIQLTSHYNDICDYNNSSLIMLGFPENAKIGEIQYLCYGDECCFLCRSGTATFRTYIMFWSCYLIFINLHMIKNCKFSVDVLVVIVPIIIKSWNSLIILI